MQVMILTIIGSILGGGALLKFIEFLIKRKDREKNNDDNVMKRFDQLETKIDDMETRFNNRFDSLRKELEDESANNARIRILTFSEEIQRGRKHSKESFDQIHGDIDRYNKHCAKYPEYPNSRADMAIKNIENVYLEALKLEGEGKDGFLN